MEIMTREETGRMSETGRRKRGKAGGGRREGRRWEGLPNITLYA